MTHHIEILDLLNTFLSVLPSVLAGVLALLVEMRVRRKDKHPPSGQP